MTNLYGRDSNAASSEDAALLKSIGEQFQQYLDGHPNFKKSPFIIPALPQEKLMFVKEFLEGKYKQEVERVDLVTPRDPETYTFIWVTPKLNFDAKNTVAITTAATVAAEFSRRQQQQAPAAIQLVPLAVAPVAASASTLTPESEMELALQLAHLLKSATKENVVAEAKKILSPLSAEKRACFLKLVEMKPPKIASPAEREKRDILVQQLGTRENLGQAVVADAKKDAKTTTPAVAGKPAVGQAAAVVAHNGVGHAKGKATAPDTSSSTVASGTEKPSAAEANPAPASAYRSRHNI
jgi:hypothetical protein